MNEPTLSQVHSDLVERLELDKRLRDVEQDNAALKLLPAEIRRMEERLVTAIESNRPKPPWQAASALVAAAAFIFLIAAAIYGVPKP